MKNKILNWALGITAIGSVIGGIYLGTNKTPETLSASAPKIELTINDTIPITIKNVVGVSFPNLNSITKVDGNSAIIASLKRINAGYIAWANGTISRWYAVRDLRKKNGISYNCSDEGKRECDDCDNGANFSTWDDYLFTADTMNSNLLFTVNVGSALNDINNFYSLLDSAKKDIDKKKLKVSILQLGVEIKIYMTIGEYTSTCEKIIPTLKLKFPNATITADTYGDNDKWNSAASKISGVTANRYYYSVQDTPDIYNPLHNYAMNIAATTDIKALQYGKNIVWLQCAFKNSNPQFQTNAHGLFWFELLVRAADYNVHNENKIDAICQFNMKTLFDSKTLVTASPYYGVMEASKIFNLTYAVSSINADGLYVFGGKDSSGDYTELILNPTQNSVTIDKINVNNKKVKEYSITTYYGDLQSKNYLISNDLIIEPNSFTTIKITK